MQCKQCGPTVATHNACLKYKQTLVHVILTELRTEQVRYQHDEQQADTTERPTEGSNNQENTEDTKDNKT